MSATLVEGVMRYPAGVLLAVIASSGLAWSPGEVDYSANWPRIGVLEPYPLFQGWAGDTAVVYEVVYQCCVGDSTGEMVLVSAEGVARASIDEWSESIGTAHESRAFEDLDAGVVVADASMIREGRAAFDLGVSVDGDELEAMYESCREFEEYLEAGPPPVTAELTLADSTGQVVWRAFRELGWTAGECGPLFELPKLDLAVLSPDSRLVYVCILYGDYLEHHVIRLR